jgi:hypothetical protein
MWGSLVSGPPQWHKGFSKIAMVLRELSQKYNPFINPSNLFVNSNNLFANPNNLFVGIPELV